MNQKQTPTPTPTPRDDDHYHKEHSDKEVSAYEKFIVENRKFWLCFNFWAIVGSIGLAVGTFLVVYGREEDCAGIKGTLWLVFIMHIVNALENFLNITGLDKKLCGSMTLCGFFVFEITVLIYM